MFLERNIVCVHVVLKDSPLLTVGCLCDVSIIIFSEIHQVYAKRVSQIQIKCTTKLF